MVSTTSIPSVTRPKTVCFPSRAAGSGTGRVPALDHEVRDDAVKDHAFVEALGGKLEEIAHGRRGVLREELEVDGSVVRVQDDGCHSGAG